MGIFDMVSSFIHPERAFKQAEKASSRSWQEAQGFLRPYFDAGVNQIDRLNTAENSLLNPMNLENQWIEGYETSPYARQLLDQNRSQGLDLASSMGLMGSSAALDNVQRGAGNIVSQDRQKYLEDLMNKYLAGIGLGQSIYGTGASTGGSLAEGALSYGRDMAGLEYGRAAAPGNFFGNLLNTASNIGLNLATGGLSGTGSNFVNASNTFNPGFGR